MFEDQSIVSDIALFSLLQLELHQVPGCRPVRFAAEVEVIQGRQQPPHRHEAGRVEERPGHTQEHRPQWYTISHTPVSKENDI